MLFIFTLNLKSECIKVFDFKPNPSEPNNKTFLPSQLLFVKSLVAETSNALTQKSLVLRKKIVELGGNVEEPGT